MAILTLQLPEVKTEPEGRPRSCSHCGAATLHWQGILDELTEILEELPPDGGYRLFQL